MHFRIGVNVGDVVEEEDRIYGDGVNIAARIQEAAESNSVFVSQSLFDQVKRQSAYMFEDLGLHSLKNISEQIRLYKVIGDMPTHRFFNSPSKKTASVAGVREAAKHRLPSCLLKSPRRTPTIALLMLGAFAPPRGYPTAISTKN
jgi:hypothetical protein